MAEHDKTWDELEAKLLEGIPDAQAKVAAIELAMRDAEELYALRRRRGLTQAQLAKLMHTHQPHVSRIERGADLYLSTLRNYVEAMGGRLEVAAVFDDERVPLTTDFTPAAVGEPT